MAKQKHRGHKQFRKFNNKQYEIHGTTFRKEMATKLAKGYRGQGWLVRIVSIRYYKGGKLYVIYRRRAK